LAFCLTLQNRVVGAAEPGRGSNSGRSGVPESPEVIALTFEEALQLAAERAPELASARAAETGAARLERESRSLLVRSPELSVAVGPRFGDDISGVDVSVTLLQPLSLGGVRAARSRFSAARLQSARAGSVAVRARMALAAGLAWIDARVAGELIRLRARGLQEAEVLDGLAAARLASGAVTAGERALVHAVLGAARAALLEAQGRRFAADAEIAFYTGLSPEGLEAVGPLELDGPPITEAEAVARAGLHSELGYLEAESRVLRRSVEQLRAEGSGILSVGPSVTREATGDLIILGHVSLPLPFANSNRFEVAERERQALVAEAELVRQRARLRTDTLVALHERTHARGLRDALARDAVGPARVALDEAMLRYREGKAPLFEVLTARRAHSESEERWIEAAGAARAAGLRLLWVTGRLVPEVS
jgi:cobalt-zinc-cadmium efflux system outer membrane protein